MRVVVRAPNHLGDGVMALPAVHALAEVASVRILAPRWGADLYRDVPAVVEPPGPVHDADAAVLFPPSFRVAWQARRARRRIGVAADARRWLLTDVVAPGRHRRDTYANLARVLGAAPRPAPTWRPRHDDPAVDVPVGHIGLNPLSPSGGVREWPRFRQLADRLGVPVFYAGPGEGSRLASVAGPHRQVVGLPLPAFARALRRCAVFVSNDSGAAHFARAVGVPTVVVFGSTDPAHTGPHGAVPVVGPRLACAPCRRQRCAAALECLETPVDDVLAAIGRAVA